jgi:hypothetical protein
MPTKSIPITDHTPYHPRGTTPTTSVREKHGVPYSSHEAVPGQPIPPAERYIPLGFQKQNHQSAPFLLQLTQALLWAAFIICVCATYVLLDSGHIMLSLGPALAAAIILTLSLKITLK